MTDPGQPNPPERLAPGGRRQAVITTIGTLSGGIGSWAACSLWLDEHGAEGFACLFADTGNEHPDTYRFLDDAARELDVPLYRVGGAVDIWQPAWDHRWIPNSRRAHCSWDLKTKPSAEWIRKVGTVTTILVGIDATEDHRLPDITERWGEEGLTVRAPLVEAGWWKSRARDRCEAHGLRPSEMYALGFGHANCIGCFKAGQGHWLRVREQFPDIFAYHRDQEAALRAELGQGTILRDWSQPGAPGMTLAELERRAAEHDPQLDLWDEGGCGCFA